MDIEIKTNKYVCWYLVLGYLSYPIDTSLVLMDTEDTDGNGIYFKLLGV